MPTGRGMVGTEKSHEQICQRRSIGVEAGLGEPRTRRKRKSKKKSHLSFVSSLVRFVSFSSWSGTLSLSVTKSCGEATRLCWPCWLCVLPSLLLCIGSPDSSHRLSRLEGLNRARKNHITPVSPSANSSLFSSGSIFSWLSWLSPSCTVSQSSTRKTLPLTWRTPSSTSKSSSPRSFRHHLNLLGKPRFATSSRPCLRYSCTGVSCLRLRLRQNPSNR